MESDRLRSVPGPFLSSCAALVVLGKSFHHSKCQCPTHQIGMKNSPRGWWRLLAGSQAHSRWLADERLNLGMPRGPDCPYLLSIHSACGLIIQSPQEEVAGNDFGEKEGSPQEGSDAADLKSKC